jgi:hypothetical protein
LTTTEKQTHEQQNKIFIDLAKPFDIEDVYFLPQSVTKDGMATVAAYADKRAYAERLDIVLGKANWQLKVDPPTIAQFHKEVKDWDNKDENGKFKTKIMSGLKVFVVAHVGILNPSGEWVWKSSTGAADTADENSVTTAEAQAVKRAISMWGPGNYFYRLPKQTLPYNKLKGFLSEPSLPDWAIPEYECYDCKHIIESFTWKDQAGNEQTMVGRQVLIRSRQQYDKDLCANCQKKRRETGTPQVIKDKLGK